MAAEPRHEEVNRIKEYALRRCFRPEEKKNCWCWQLARALYISHPVSLCECQIRIKRRLGIESITYTFYVRLDGEMDVRGAELLNGRRVGRVIGEKV